MFSRSNLPAPASLALLAAALLFSAPAQALQCGDAPEGFPAWLAEFKQQAVANGVSPRAVQASLAGVTYDSKVISRDRGQGGVFHKSFEDFASRLVTPSRIAKGRALMKRHAALLKNIERHYGVPANVVVAIWGLETSYGADNGNFKIFNSLATLAYDCRRSDNFTQELMDALRIVERGYMAPAQMRGDWAGEIGQTQLMPSSYLKYAVDYDGDGTRDLIHDTADALASTANFLAQKGWSRGAGYHEGEPNFTVLQEWNKAEVYVRTIGALADRLAGANE
jgi:lytic murein transglycosylase